jgi:hypothetical protein
MLLVYVIDDGESTGIMTSVGKTVVRFPAPVADDASLTHPDITQNARRVPVHMIKKIPGKWFFFGSKRLISKNLGCLEIRES